MSVISFDMSSFFFFVSDADSDMKKKVFDCLEAVIDEYENEIFDDVMLLPDSLEKLF